jgi:hypothetical protein
MGERFAGEMIGEFARSQRTLEAFDVAHGQTDGGFVKELKRRPEGVQVFQPTGWRNPFAPIHFAKSEIVQEAVQLTFYGFGDLPPLDSPLAGIETAVIDANALCHR